jgi:hypothetical protein
MEAILQILHYISYEFVFIKTPSSLSNVLYDAILLLYSMGHVPPHNFL